jgi:hypothetical protein
MAARMSVVEGSDFNIGIVASGSGHRIKQYGVRRDPVHIFRLKIREHPFLSTVMWCMV